MLIKDRMPKSEFPDIIISKEHNGNCRIDSIVGKNLKGAIVTIVKRKTAFFLMKKLEFGKDAKAPLRKLTGMLIPHKRSGLFITSDVVCEFATHNTISNSLKLTLKSLFYGKK